MLTNIIYIMDPQCSWCFGNSEQFQLLHHQLSKKVSFQLLMGGFWLDSNAPRGSRQLVRELQEHSPQVEAVTGVKMADSYFQLAKNENYTFSSLPPAAAIILIKKISPSHTITFTKAVQDSLFINGQRLDLLETYQPILQKHNINLDLFQKHWMSSSNIKETNKEFKLAEQFTSVYPTLLFEGESSIQLLATGHFNGSKIKIVIEEIYSEHKHLQVRKLH